MLDIYLPEKVDQALPLVIYIHGGGWSGGDKKYFPAQVLVSQGYAVASINYRFIKEAIFPAQIHDCKGAVRWLRAHAKEYHFDPDHFGVWGDSAGGHLVALLGASGDAKEIEGDVGGNLDQSSRVQCVIDWYGPTDMSVFFEQAEQQSGKVENIFKKDPDHSVIAQLFGGPTREHEELVQQANPVHFVTKDDAPFLIMHGDKDTLVPLAQSEMLAEALKKAGVEVHLETYEGAGHGGPAFFSPTARGMMLQFLNKHLKSEKNTGQAGAK